MTTSTVALAPVFVALSSLPDSADLPTAVRKAVALWESTYNDLTKAEQDRVGLAATYSETYAERHAQALRAKAEGTPATWPEKDAVDGINGKIEVLRLLVEERHNDAARALAEHAFTERDKIDSKLAPAAAAELQTAIDNLEAALLRVTEVAGLRHWWDFQIIGPNGSPTSSSGGAIRNAAFEPSSTVVTPFGHLGARRRMSVAEIVNPLRQITADQQ